MSSGFGGRPGYDVNTSQVFLRVYQQLSPCRDGAKDGESRAATRCELGLPFKCVLSFSLTSILAPEESSAGTRGAGMSTRCVLGPRLWPRLWPEICF